MPFLVTDSASPLAFETLPALKVTEFYGQPRRGEVYSYLRCYVHKGALHYLSLIHIFRFTLKEIRFCSATGRAMAARLL